MGALKKVTPRAVIAELKPSRGVWATIPELNDAVLFLEIEGKTLGVYLSTAWLAGRRRFAEPQPWIDDFSLVATLSTAAPCDISHGAPAQGAVTSTTVQVDGCAVAATSHPAW